jgi:hypothetical protein
MSDYNTNYSVKDATSLSNVDLTNIFQLNPNSPSITTTFFNPPYTISGTAPFVEYVSGWYILTFNSSSSITFNTITTVYTTVVGGGGGGGSSSTANSNYASGGNGGSVCNGYFSSDTNQITITVGSGGTGGTSGGNGSNGNTSSISSSSINITCPGGNHGVTGQYWPSGQSAVTSSGVSVMSFTQVNSITGGNFPVGNRNSSGVYQFSNGINGIGVSIPPNSSRIEYFGGGGASCGTYCGGAFGFSSPPSGGLGGGGNGGYNSEINNNNTTYAFIEAGSGMNGRGGGGGGGTYFYNSVSGDGGDGGSGSVIFCFKYP